jgi:hypothetical protein
VQDRYIFQQTGADQHVGRTVNCLPYTTLDLGCITPHFKPGSSINIEELRVLASIEKLKTESFVLALPFLAANLLAHKKFLETYFGENHPIHNMPIFSRGWAGAHENDVVCGSKLHCKCGCDMVATGVPPYIITMGQIDDIRTELEVGFNKVMNELPAHCVTALRESFNINEAQVTNHDFRTLASTMTAALEKMRDDIMADFRVLAVPITQNATVSVSTSQTSVWKLWDWSTDLPGLGKTHKVPENYVVPSSGAIHTIWLLWHLGNVSTGVCPLKTLGVHDYPRSDVNPISIKITRLKKVMLYITAVWDEITSRSQDYDNEDNWNSTLAKVISELGEKTNPKSFKLSIATWYGRIGLAQKASRSPPVVTTQPPGLVVQTPASVVSTTL